MRIPTTKKISELWPKVAKITIKRHQIYRSAFGLFEEDKQSVFTPGRAADITFDCINTDCTVGYFDLWSVVSDMYHHDETYLEGAMECRGNEAPDHSNRCPCILEYQITIEYQ